MGDTKRTEKQPDQTLKKDAGKVPISLIPFEFIEGIAKVLEFGAGKYGRYCWSQGMDWHRVLDAAYRHLGDWEKGIEVDSETKKNHLLHAACCLMFLYLYQTYGIGKDTRWVRPKGEENGKIK